MPKLALLLLTTALFCGCKTPTVVYTAPPPPPRTQIRERQVTNTVYVERDHTPTSLPGNSRRIANPGDPERFRAVDQNADR